jgi:CDP-diacylglycerol--glycerol-3-phosphate 3-phosphatidyltransferase
VNIPNILSISRIPVVFVIVWLMDCGSVNTAQWAFGLYVVSALTDWLDGYLARKWQQITDFGKFIDALADKVLTSGLFVGLLSLGRLPEWGLYMVLLILTREFMVTGLRLVAAGKGHIMPAEKLGKWKTALQMITIGLYLCRDAKLAEIPQVILNNVGDVAFGAAGVLTVVSGVSYFWKNRSLFA